MGVRPPSGTVTFLFTDVVGSTELWEREPGPMRDALARHDALLHAAVDQHDGYVFATGGDGLAAAFARASDAVGAAITAQSALLAEPWPEGASLTVRMGLHSGEADERDGDFFGATVNRAARVMSVATGGQILLSAVTAGLVSAVPGVELRSVGSRRLRGVSEPVDLVVALASGVELDATPPAVDVVDGNLPRPVTEYVGDLAELRRRIGRLSGQRLVTLTGSGGVGKTRTAIEIGWLSSDQFRGGVWLIELAPVGVGEAIPAVVAAALGLQPQPGATMTESIVAWLSARPTLLIVDNCEHVLDPVADLVRAIESGTPETTVLATSRERLGLPGEIVRRVPSLDPATDGMRLFVERAAAVDGFVIDDSNRDAVIAICGRLDGIPLAIELAAARARALSPSEILGRLDDRFRLLRNSGRGGHERHQTLRATVAWSVQLLSPDQRCLFERLSVFAGSFSLDDAETVCGFDPLDTLDVVDLLSGLVDRSMVVAEPGGDGSTRYRLLETLRQYGEETLAAADPTVTATMRDRHLAHFLERAERWYAQQCTADEPEANQAFALNWDNLRAAFDWALANGRGREVADLLHTTYFFACHACRWEHRQWAIAARAAGADSGQIASAAVVLWAGTAADLVAMTDALASLDPTAPDLAPREREHAWSARSHAAFMMNDRDGIERAVAWLHEREPECTNQIIEAWQLANILAATASAPDPALVARAHRLGQTSPSPSVQAITGQALHGHRYHETALGAGLDLGDIDEGLRHALACSRTAGNLFVEVLCLTRLVMPLTRRGDPNEAPALQATIRRIRDVKSDFALNLLVAPMAIWLVHVGRPSAASVVDGYRDRHPDVTSYPMLQATLDRLDELLDRSRHPTERSRGAAMTIAELADFLDAELTAVADSTQSTSNAGTF